MKKRIFLAACGAALMLMMTGCGSAPDLSEQYGDYLRYCFGEDYTFTDQGEVEASGMTAKHRVFKLTYNDVHGNPRVNDEITSFEYPAEEKDTFPTKQDFYNTEVANYAFREMNLIAKEEFFADYLSQYFDCEAPEAGSNPVQLSVGGGEAEVANTFFLPVFLPTNKEPDKSVALGFIQPGTGLQACTADLRSIMQDDRWMMTCSMTLSADADGAAYTQNMQQMAEAFAADTETPQNYLFLLKQRTSDSDEDLSTETLYQECVVFGKPVDLDAKRAEDPAYSPAAACSERILEKYGAAG